MAKTDNLTDFLTGLADKFRSKLGGTALINPQNFESKIDEVYQKGYDSAPQGVDTSDATAAADDVQNGKTFYAGGVKKTGSLNVTAGLVDSAVTVVDEPGNNQIYAQNAGISQKAIYNKNTKTKLLIPYNKVTSAIGLTAAKLLKGNSVCGVNGTATADATATAADILSGKTAYVNGVKVTGSVYTSSDGFGGGADLNGISLKEDGSLLVEAKNTRAAYYPANVYMSILADGSDVASVIGLTADKIVSGNTILGVQGTAISLSAGIYADNANFVNDYVELGTGIQTPRLLIATAIDVVDCCGTDSDPGYIVARFDGSWDTLLEGTFTHEPMGISKSLGFNYSDSTVLVFTSDTGNVLNLGKFAIIYDV